MSKRTYSTVLSVVLWSTWASSFAGQCSKSPEQYKAYVVQKIEIRTPISFFTAATFGFDELKSTLPLRSTQLFSERKMSEGVPLVREFVRMSAVDSVQKVKFVVVTANPVDCDDDHRTLNIRYMVFSNIYRPYISRTFEQRAQELAQPATTAAEGGTDGRLLVKPFAGYNHARHGFGGFELSALLPIAHIQRLDLRPSFSPNSATGEFSMVGSVDSETSAIEHAEWRVGLQYFDLPAGTAKVKEGMVAAQFFASTRESTEQALAGRYGISIEGGHQQTAELNAPMSAVPNSSLGAIKLYAGATGRSERQSYSATYAIELGSTLHDRTLDFAKHIIDFGFNRRFIEGPEKDFTPAPSGSVHKPFDVELHGSGGIIQSFGLVPTPERFFGGNQVSPLVMNSSWKIPNGALIRSFAQNELGGAAGGVLGGTRFYSGNLTVAKVVWGKPLLPAELARDPDFLPALRGAINTAKGELSDYYKSKDPAYSAATGELDAIETKMQELSTTVKQVEDSSPAAASHAQSIRSQIFSISRIIHAIKNGKTTQVVALVNLQLPKLERGLTSWAGELDQNGDAGKAISLRGIQLALAGSREKIKTLLAQVDSKVAQKRADDDLSVAERVLKSFLYELNIYSIAPVGIFDVARIWPGGFGVQYAAGAGIRLSLVNVNLTLGYAANPVRTIGQKAGALYVNLSVTDLFH